MNKTQENVMRLLSETPKPDVEYARTLQSLAEAAGLPARVSAGIDCYILAALDAARISNEAKEAGKAATEMWASVRHQAETTNDLVDQAETATATAAATEQSPETEAQDDLAECISSISVPAVEYFCKSRTAAESVTFLQGLPEQSNDAAACSLFEIGKASRWLIEEELIDDNTRPLVYTFIMEWLDRLAYTLNPDSGVLRKAFSPLRATEVLIAIAPSTLDILQAKRPLTEANEDQLKLASLVWSTWDQSLATGPRGAAIIKELADRQTTNRQVTSSAPAKTKGSDKLKGLDRAEQQGREAWIVDRKPSSPYTKKNYSEAYESGWNSCQRVYEEGRIAAQSPDGSPGNPYHGADPDGALARAYELGVTSVVSPESMPGAPASETATPEPSDNDETGDDDHGRIG